jgi:integrase
MDSTKTAWKKQWKTWVRPTKLPGIWARKEGGYLARARVTDATTGRLVELKKVLAEATEETAFAWLSAERARVKSGAARGAPPKQRFAEFAQRLYERKLTTREIRSARGRAKWSNTLAHLIAGTQGKKAGRKVEGFGEMYLDQIGIAHVEAWKADLAELIRAEDYAPATCNGWLSILRVVLKAAKRELALPVLATEGVRDFDESECETYTEEEPNALLPGEVPRFLEAMRELYPAHFAMTFLGLATGLRPSSLRPLRRKGPQADVLWSEGKLLVRRSHSQGPEVMNTTKNRIRYRIHLPEAVLAVLRWHIDTQLSAPEMEDSDLLFPSVTGGFRSPSVLNKPFAEVAEAIGLGKRFTQRGLRRTFNDLARAAAIEGVVTRSISGHLTERMQHHYSTVNADEQRGSIARVIDLMEARDERTAHESDPSGAPGGAPNPEVVLQTKKPASA